MQNSCLETFVEDLEPRSAPKSSRACPDLWSQRPSRNRRRPYISRRFTLGSALCYLIAAGSLLAESCFVIQESFVKSILHPFQDDPAEYLAGTCQEHDTSPVLAKGQVTFLCKLDQEA